jgi:putative transposase
LAGSQRESFRIPQGFLLDNPNGRVQVPKMGWMRYRESQDVLGQAKNLTICESCGTWYVSIQTERDVQTPQHPSTSAVGMDWGVVHFLTLSNGEVLDPCQPLKKFLPKLAKWQRRMARKKKFRKNWRKAKARITQLLQDRTTECSTQPSTSAVIFRGCSSSSGEVSPSWQEPTEGIPVSAWNQ